MPKNKVVRIITNKTIKKAISWKTLRGKYLMMLEVAGSRFQ